MAEQFLTLMADLDDHSQILMSEWYSELKNHGFTGTQTPGLPFHISLATFSPEEEHEAVELAEKTAGEFSPIDVHVSHIGIFAPGKVLFGGIERNAGLDRLHDICEQKPHPQKLWTPHITVLMDEPVAVCKAVPVFLQSFRPFTGKITRLHLCAFWPAREIASAGLSES